jgi:DNA-binding transcriptional ArsR family regulator
MKETDGFDMPGTPYRAPQICRVLGNPKAYQILLELRRRKTATTTQLATALNRTLPTVSAHLRSLREVHRVRYQRNGAKALYRLKSVDVEHVWDRLESLVEKIRQQD